MHTAAALVLLVAIGLAVGSVRAPVPWDMLATVSAAIMAALSLLLFSVARHRRGNRPATGSVRRARRMLL